MRSAQDEPASKVGDRHDFLQNDGGHSQGVNGLDADGAGGPASRVNYASTSSVLGFEPCQVSPGNSASTNAVMPLGRMLSCWSWPFWQTTGQSWSSTPTIDHEPVVGHLQVQNRVRLDGQSAVRDLAVPATLDGVPGSGPRADHRAYAGQGRRLQGRGVNGRQLGNRLGRGVRVAGGHVEGVDAGGGVSPGVVWRLWLP